MVTISNDETGISEDPDTGFEVAKKIVPRTAYYGVPVSDVVVPIDRGAVGAILTAAVQVTRLLRRLKHELKVNTTVRRLHISFGLPAREGMASAFADLGDRRRHDLRDREPVRIESGYGRLRRA